MAVGNKWDSNVMSKGSSRRPMSTGLEQFEENWNRAFNKPKAPEMLREVNYDGMWRHSCTTLMETFYIGHNEVCDACGAWEEDGQ